MKFSFDILFETYAIANVIALGGFLVTTAKNNKFNAIEKYFSDDMEQNGIKFKHIAGIFFSSAAITVYSGLALVDLVVRKLTGLIIKEKAHKTNTKEVTIESKAVETSSKEGKEQYN